MLLFRFIRVRLTLWYALLLAALLAAFSVGLYVALRQALDENLSDSLEGRATIVVALVTVSGQLDTAGVAVPGDPLEGEHFARIFDSQGRLLLDNSLPQFAQPPDPGAVNAALDGRQRFRDMDTQGEYLRVLTSPIVVNGEIVGVVEVGQSQGEARETLSRLLLIIVVAYPLTLIAAIVGGLWLAGRALSPIDRLTQSARGITAQSMSGRIDTTGPDDELERLARTFDQMIGRLDDSFRRQRQFTSDASHELRTPLTAIKGQIEVALQRNRSAEDYRDVLQGVNQEVERLVRLVGSLLSMARAVPKSTTRRRTRTTTVRFSTATRAKASPRRGLCTYQPSATYMGRGIDSWTSISQPASQARWGCPLSSAFAPAMSSACRIE